MSKALRKDRISEDDIRQSYFRHAANAQLLRWYQFDENPVASIKNQLDLLTDEIVIKSPSGRICGKEQYLSAMNQRPSIPLNAHRVKNTALKVVENNALSLSADITYSEEIDSRNSQLHTQHLTYQTTLVYNETILPRFKSISISEASTAIVKNQQFECTYSSNRLKSLVHYLMAIVEHPGRDPEYLREILAPKFDIRLSEAKGNYTSFEELAGWMTGPVACMSATRHIAHSMRSKQVDENEYEMSLLFDWDGIRLDGAILTAKTRHTWRVVDDPSERFARIKKIRVRYLEPYELVTT